MQTKNFIQIGGAKVHNLKNISVELPKNKLIIITGVSGSGKSSLAFDTIYAEGQRRFIESLSSYARQFLEKMEKPNVDFIHGISPSIAIEQKTITTNPRATVGTTTEIYDYFRILFARVGKTYCKNCSKIISEDTIFTIKQKLNQEKNGSKLYVLFKIENKNLESKISELQKNGFYSFLLNDEIVNGDKILNSNNHKEIFVVVDKLSYEKQNETQFVDSIEIAFKFGNNQMQIFLVEKNLLLNFDKQYRCANCNLDYIKPSPQIFSFNTPIGACSNCQGFGKTTGIDIDLVVPNKSLSINDGGINCWTGKFQSYLTELKQISKREKINLDIPFLKLSQREIDIILFGTYDFDGIYKFFDYIKKKSYKIYYRFFLSKYRGFSTCNTCNGSRLKIESSYIKINEKNIFDVVQMSLYDAQFFFENLKLSEYDFQISSKVLEEIKKRIKYLVDLGIGYLTVDRQAMTLSGGESQRINLATGLGTALTGTLYVLDEPTIGLHSRDTEKLVSTLKLLRDLKNTVIVVEHDKEVIKSADFIVDIGPLAGEFGGKMVFSGNLNELKKNKKSLTSDYIFKRKKIDPPNFRNNGSGKKIFIKNAYANNLKNIDIKIPLNCFVAITGVSGSGKSTLVYDIIYNGFKKHSGKFSSIIGLENIDNIELVEQTPIGKTTRSNPITYLKIYDLIRTTFANTHKAKINGFTPTFFSFNVSGGRCETCFGDGFQTIEMQFLSDIILPCETCNGKKFKQEILKIKYNEKNITEILDMTVSEAISFFSNFSDGKKIAKNLEILNDVGLSYLHLGQPTSTLSGGESQRLKLASFLQKNDEKKHTLFIFDEPTNGLHFHDIKPLLNCFTKLLKQNNSLIVIEHNLDVIKCADWLIDLGPDSGIDGGKIVAEGTPEEIAQNKNSVTGKFLLKEL